MGRRGYLLIKEMVGRHPLPFLVSVLGSALFAAATVGATVVLGRVTDRLVFPTFETGRLPDDAFLWGVVAILAVTALRAVGVMSRRFFAGMTADRNQRTYQQDLADKYLAMPMAWYQENPTGRLLAHADSDVTVTSESLHPLPFSIGVASLAFFSAASILVVDVSLALVAFTIFPALVVLNRYYTGRIERPAAEVQEGVGEVSTIAHESFDGALVVKTLGRARAESKRFDEAVQELRANRVDVGYTRAMFEPFLDALPNLGIVLVVVFGAYRINAGAITVGDLVQVAALFSVLAFPMRVFGFFLESIPPAVVARERLETVLSAPDPDPVAHPSDLPDGPLGLVARGVSYRYDDPLVLDGVDLAIEPGEVVALVGSTGSGKSTLCTVLAGLLPPTTGQVELGGQPVGQIDPAQRADAVAFVFQETFLFADTLRANIELSMGADHPGADSDFARAAAIARVDEFLGAMPNGWDTVVGERGVTLSGGQRQRVALARALIRRPRLLILDDATSAVDPLIELEILQGLRTDDDSHQPPTTLIVAQRVSTIELADRILYLDGGRIAGSGTHSELMNLPGYKALVEAYELARQ